MNEQLNLHDIKALEPIPDISFYIFLLLLVLALAFILLIIFFVYKFFKNKKPNKRKEYFKILKEIDLEDSKNAAYTITKYARLLAKSDREIKTAQELIEELEKYKYKKEVKALNNSVKTHFDRFMDIIDV